ncbi:MAG: 50S ribosomal protein L17 [uncultured bacterium]|nr:MAG: 50S ribosomal protein L17 [uncultured bacterium]
MRKFGRKKQNREMMLRNLATSLIIFEKITTTQAKAKEIKPIIDKLITTGKLNNLASRRRLLGYLLHKNAVNKILEDLIIRYNDRSSGYTKSYHLAPRLGDGSKMMILELIPAKKNIAKNSEEEKSKTNKLSDEKSSSNKKIALRTKNVKTRTK